MESFRMNTTLYRDICECCVPQQLLKFGRGGKFNKPGFREFFLNGDLTALHWRSRGAGGEKSVMLAKVSEIRFGQRTEKFKKNGRPDLAPTSFSLIYGNNESLDIVCADEKEFQRWTSVLEALIEKKLDSKQLDVGRMKVREYMNAKKQKVIEDNEDEKDEGTNDVYGFGNGSDGQNGCKRQQKPELADPKLVESLLGKGVIAASCGWFHTSIITELGECYQYGNCIGTGFSQDTYTPTIVNLKERDEFVQVACGAFHSIAINIQGNVFSWGANIHGQLGLGDSDDRKSPILIEDLLSTPMGLELRIFKIACGAHSTIALSEDGNVYTWGSGENGTLGHGETKDQLKPRAIQDFGSDVNMIAAGDCHMVACTDTSIYTWGWNGCGQLGLGHENDKYRPEEIETLQNERLMDISCGAAHTVCVINNAVWSWGLNSHGQLGLVRKKKFISVPKKIEGLPNMRNVACGGMHTCIISTDDMVYSTGHNKFGQLGTGKCNDLDQFTHIESLKDKKTQKVFCGGQHSTVLTLRRWVADEEADNCMLCEQKFTSIKRRHHCRKCLGVFCGACSNKKMAILSTKSTKQVRVCITCFNQNQ